MAAHKVPILLMLMSLAIQGGMANDTEDENRDIYRAKHPGPEISDNTICGDLPDGDHMVPGDCGSFYRCEGGDFVSHYECLDGSYYNPIEMGCTLASDLDDVRYLECFGACTRLPNDVPDGFYEVPGDCTKYVQCSAFGYDMYECPFNTYFNPSDGQCKNANELDPGRLEECTTVCGVPDDLLVYPGDCTRYLQCFEGALYNRYCTPGFYFEPAYDLCVAAEQLTPERYNECFFCSGNPNGLYEYPGDCTKYILCTDGVMEEGDCPLNTYFNLIYDTCTDRDLLSDDRHYECFGFCTSFPDGVYPYPGDCERYIVCINNDDYISECPPSQFYNPDTESCTRAIDLSDDRYMECFGIPPPLVPTPAPTDHCLGVPDGEFRPYPFDCQSYCVCVDNQCGDIQECLFGLYFDPNTLTCVEWEDLDLGDQLACLLYCVDGSGVYTHPLDCQMFVHCDNGIPYQKECPADLYWDPSLETCNYDYQLPPDRQEECGLTADMLECSGPNAVLPDLIDCHKYIICESGSPSTETCEPLYYSPNPPQCATADQLCDERQRQCELPVGSVPCIVE